MFLRRVSVPGLLDAHVLCRRLVGLERRLSRHIYTARLNIEQSVIASSSSQEFVSLARKWHERLPLAAVDVQHCMKILECHDELSSERGELLVRCCGKSMPLEPADVRVKTANTVLRVMQQHGNLSIEHANALLATYLENRFAFSPVMFLRRLQEKSIVPNHVTMEYLILRYSDMGDMAAAMQLLNVMRESSMPINLATLCSLLYGFIKTNDDNGASEIEALMKKFGMEPSYVYHIAIARGAACIGDCNLLLAELHNAQRFRKQQQIAYQDVMDLVVLLTENGHQSYIESVLAMIPDKTNAYVRLASLTLLRLLTMRQHAAAFAILSSIPVQDTDAYYDVVSLFFQQLLKERNIELPLVVNYASSLQTSTHAELAERLIQRALYLKQQNFADQMRRISDTIKNHNLNSFVPKHTNPVNVNFTSNAQLYTRPVYSAEQMLQELTHRSKARTEYQEKAQNEELERAERLLSDLRLQNTLSGGDDKLEAVANALMNVCSIYASLRESTNAHRCYKQALAVAPRGFNFDAQIISSLAKLGAEDGAKDAVYAKYFERHLRLQQDALRLNSSSTYRLASSPP